MLVPKLGSVQYSGYTILMSYPRTRFYRIQLDNFIVAITSKYFDKREARVNSEQRNG